MTSVVFDKKSYWYYASDFRILEATTNVEWRAGNWKETFEMTLQSGNVTPPTNMLFGPVVNDFIAYLLVPFGRRLNVSKSSDA